PFRVMITGSDEVTLARMWRNRIRGVLAPVTRAASTNGSTLTDSVALRTTRKYCGTNTAMIATDADRMAPILPDCPGAITIDTTIANSSDGIAYSASITSTNTLSSQPPR